MIWSVNDKISQQRDLQRSTFFRDKSEGWKDYVLFELLNILSSAIGSLTNPSKLLVTFKSVKNKTISKDTIIKYIIRKLRTKISKCKFLELKIENFALGFLLIYENK